MKLRPNLLIVLLVLNLVLVSCNNHKIDAEVIDAINEVCPNSGKTTVFYKSMIRAAENKLDSLGEMQLAESIDKIYYFNLKPNEIFHADRDSVYTKSLREIYPSFDKKLDSIVAFQQYEPMAEANLKNESYFISMKTDGDEISEVLVLAKRDGEVHLVQIYGRLNLNIIQKVLPMVLDGSGLNLPIL